MSKGNTYENELLLLIFNNTPMTLVGDASGILGSALPGSFYFALHSSDPGEAGTQATNEVSYTGYARVAVARTGAGFVVTGNSVSPADDVDFGQCTAGSVTASHFSLGVASSGSTKLLYKGAFNASIAIAVNTIPRIASGTTITED
jgi:hypothetical protein